MNLHVHEPPSLTLNTVRYYRRNTYSSCIQQNKFKYGDIGPVSVEIMPPRKCEATCDWFLWVFFATGDIVTLCDIATSCDNAKLRHRATMRHCDVMRQCDIVTVATMQHGNIATK